MKRTFLASTTFFFATVLLTGCSPPVIGTSPGVTSGASTSVANTTPANHACIASFVTPAGDFKGSGFEIPLGKWAGGPIKIGSVDYNHAQAQKLSEAASLAEQSRLAFCRATDPAILTLLSEASRADVVMTAITGQRNIQTKVDKFVTSVKNAKDPQEAVSAADELAKTAKDAKKEIEQKAPTASLDKQPSWSPTNEPLPAWVTMVLMQAKTEDALRELSDKFNALDKRLNNEKGQDQIKIMGFNENGVSLAATERQRLYGEFQEALSKIPHGQRPIVFIVGYASKHGNHLQNVDIGLRRAQAVKNYLQEQKFSRAYEGRVMSGGIDDSAYEQRVDVFITGA